MERTVDNTKKRSAFGIGYRIAINRAIQWMRENNISESDMQNFKLKMTKRNGILENKKYSF